MPLSLYGRSGVSHDKMVTTGILLRGSEAKALSLHFDAVSLLVSHSPCKCLAAKSDIATLPDGV